MSLLSHFSSLPPFSVCTCVCLVPCYLAHLSLSLSLPPHRSKSVRICKKHCTRMLQSFWRQKTLRRCMSMSTRRAPLREFNLWCCTCRDTVREFNNSCCLDLRAFIPFMMIPPCGMPVHFLVLVVHVVQFMPCCCCVIGNLPMSGSGFSEHSMRLLSFSCAGCIHPAQACSNVFSAAFLPWSMLTF